MVAGLSTHTHTPVAPCPCSYGGSTPAGRPGLGWNGSQGAGLLVALPISHPHGAGDDRGTRPVCAALSDRKGSTSQGRGRGPGHRERLCPSSSCAGSDLRKHNTPQREAVSTVSTRRRDHYSKTITPAGGRGHRVTARVCRGRSERNRDTRKPKGRTRELRHQLPRNPAAQPPTHAVGTVTLGQRDPAGQREAPGERTGEPKTTVGSPPSGTRVTPPLNYSLLFLIFLFCSRRCLLTFMGLNSTTFIQQDHTHPIC